MRIDSIRASVLAIPFKVVFKHASAERKQMQSLWVEARSGDRVGVGEGCPREYVTSETLVGAMAFVERQREAWMSAIHDAESLAGYVQAFRKEIDTNPAAWCAVELALMDLFGMPAVSGTFRYSAVIGDGSRSAFEAQLGHYRKAGFGDYKIKLSGDWTRDRAKVDSLRNAGIAPQSVRADCNNLFPDADAAIAHLASLDFPFFAIEEPLRVGNYDGMRAMARALGARIVLDESLLRIDQLAELRDDADLWIANIRVSKMGGLLRSLEVAAQARRCGIRVIVGAHVGETSVLTRAGLAVAIAAGDALVAQEGAFGTHLLERDVVDPPLMFGAGGYLTTRTA